MHNYFFVDHHFSANSSHIHARLSQTYAEYPRYLEGFVLVYTFAASNYKIAKSQN